jgi:hypothetical protein
MYGNVQYFKSRFNHRRKTMRKIITAALALTITLTLSCSDDKDDGGGGAGISSPSGNAVEPIKKTRIGGVSQKGPFISGSTATLRELDADFNQTGRSFSDIIADDHGKFDIRIGVELVSPYAMLEANGFYRNEVTGKISTAPITLYAIADLREKDNVNVNLLTHLEYYRVLRLVESNGKTVAEAKKQAQKEILAVFNIDSDGFINSEDMSIFGTSEGDAALLAISVLLQSNLSEGNFSQRLTNFAQSLRTSGKWENEADKKNMADWASRDGYFCSDGYTYWRARANEIDCSFGVRSVFSDPFNPDPHLIPNDTLAFSATSVKKNILGWNLSSVVPDFEKYINMFYGMIYNFGICDSQSQWSIKKSPETPQIYVCKDNLWQWVTEKDIRSVVHGDCSASNEGSKKIIDGCYRETESLSYALVIICKNGIWVTDGTYNKNEYYPSYDDYNYTLEESSLYSLSLCD